MTTHARVAIREAEELDRSIVRNMREYGGTYEAHMAEHMHDFFSYDFWGRHFELRFTFNGREYAFMGYNYRDKIMDTTRNEVLELYDNVHAVKAMLRDRYFGSLNKWGAACQNAVGGNINSMPLLGRRLFAGGEQCYEDLILGAKAAREASGVEVSDLGEADSSGSEASDQEHPRWMSTGPLMPCSSSSAESGGD
jgi:hypothetical protein